mmetsp:Transcript_48670/g.156318  ORF Transcript_48670/g.156318 Transcript_48670/m.156318 type:complete len:677 (-) Transcript_48670:170-2200(-)
MVDRRWRDAIAGKCSRDVIRVACVAVAAVLLVLGQLKAIEYLEIDVAALRADRGSFSAYFDAFMSLGERTRRPYVTSLTTRWTEAVTADGVVPWDEYPRPGLRREQWTNLNGKWDYAVTPLAQQAPPTAWTGKILVPFGLESMLSGVQRLLTASEALWYHREVSISKVPGRLLFLNFEAVDYRCQAWVNNQSVGEHVGGFTAFRFQITDAAVDGINTIVVRVEDATGSSQPRGKQVREPGEIWYTPTSGIWQTVWLESVPETHIERLEIVTRSLEAEAGVLELTPFVFGAPTSEAISCTIEVSDDSGKVVATAQVGVDLHAAQHVQLRIPFPKPWTPDTPNLYDVRVCLVWQASGDPIDEVRSYTGLRVLGRTRDEMGHLRFTLNGSPIFHFGTLDQGFWPDGLLTPPSDVAMQYDIQFLKDAGFNMVRKHIKVEPRRFYYHCDRLGLLVWQDQVSAGEKHDWPQWTMLEPEPADADAAWDEEGHRQFLAEYDAMVALLFNHPCIVVWVPFNEAWGQHRTMEVGRLAVARDESRHINIASGGNFWPVGHIVDQHNYPDPAFSFDEERFDQDFIKVVGEFGGHGFAEKGHMFRETSSNWGYGSGLPETREELVRRYETSIEHLVELKASGIAAGVYTQTTDVEIELNGLITYDRRVIKLSASDLNRIHAQLELKATA